MHLDVKYIRGAVLRRELDDVVLANVLEALDELVRASRAIDKALSALETNPVTGHETAYAVLLAYKSSQ